MKLLLANFFLHAWGALPFSVVHRIGNGIGWLLYITNSKLRRVTEINLQHCFPEKNKQQRDQLTRQILKEKIKEITESPAIWTKSYKALTAQISHVSGEEAMDEAFKKREGVIVLGAHMGAFYLANAILGPKYKGVWLYKPQKGIVEALSKPRRKQYHVRFVPTNKTGVMTVMRELSSGGLVGMSCDHDAGETGGLFAPFFNMPAWTMGLPARLANKTKAPVFFIFLERLKRGKGFHLHVIPMGEGMYSDDLTAGVTAMNKNLESIVRQFPTQYDWTYKRFRRRPENEKNIY